MKKSFGIHNDPDKEASIQRFSHFWQLTGSKYKDLFFPNCYFAENNKVGLFMILDILDDLNRHGARTGSSKAAASFENPPALFL